MRLMLMGAICLALPGGRFGASGLSANAGDDQTVASGFLVGLDGGASTGEKLQFEWTQLSGPPTTLDLRFNKRSTALFETPDVEVPTDFQFQLRVTNRDTQESDTDNVTITVIPPQVQRYILVDPNGTTSGGAGSLDDPIRRQTLQSAVDLPLQPGDLVYIRAGVYRPVYNSGSPNQNNRVVKRTSAPFTQGSPTAPIRFTKYPGDSGEVILDGDPDPTFSGFQTGWEMFNAAWVQISDIRFRRFKASAINLRASSGAGSSHHVTLSRVVVYEKHPNNTGWNPGIMPEGPVQFFLIRECEVRDYSGGIILWEYPAVNATQARVPPVAGNTALGSPSGGYLADMPESEWDEWSGWVEFAARYCVIRDSLAFQNSSTDSPGNSDNFEVRYAIDCVVKNNAAFACSDDNFDMAGATRLEFYGNLSFACLGDGDGNGVKIGVRGGLDNIVYRNFSFGNKRCGFDLADTERPRVFNNTSFSHENNFGFWFEAVRSSQDGIVAVNNLSIQSAQSEMSKYPSARVQRVDSNAISDRADSTFAISQGANSLLSVPDVFSNSTLSMDTQFEPDWSTARRIAYLREQVERKLSVPNSSIVVDRGVEIPGITEGYFGSAPDIGAFEFRLVPDPDPVTPNRPGGGGGCVLSIALRNDPERFWYCFLEWILLGLAAAGVGRVIRAFNLRRTFSDTNE